LFNANDIKGEKIMWHVQRMCTDVGDYQLIVEQQKKNWKCEQTQEYWKWSVIYHGTIVSTGVVPQAEQAQQLALANIPLNS
jgi:hypothetical protein